MTELINDVVTNLEELQDDNSIPKNIKLKINDTIRLLQDEGEVSIKVNKALQHLDEISEDTNMQPYTRTQIWNIVSILEKLSSN